MLPSDGVSDAETSDHVQLSTVAYPLARGVSTVDTSRALARVKPMGVLSTTIDSVVEVPPNTRVDVTADVTVRAGGRLVIRHGAVLRFGKTSSLIVEDGALVVEGTSADPVVFTSAAATPAPADWGGIWFSTVAQTDVARRPGSTMQHTIVEFGGGVSKVNGDALEDIELDVTAGGGIVVGLSGYAPDGNPIKPIELRGVHFQNNGRRGLDARSFSGIGYRPWRTAALTASNLSFGSNQGVSARVPVTFAPRIAGRETEAIVLTGTHLSGKLVLPKPRRSYFVEGTLALGDQADKKPAAELELSEGTTIHFDRQSSIVLRGTGTVLHANDAHFLSAQESPVPGDWLGIEVLGISASIHLNHCRFEHAVRAIYLDHTDDRTNLTLNNTNFRHLKDAVVATRGNCATWTRLALTNQSPTQPICAKQESAWRTGRWPE